MATQSDDHLNGCMIALMPTEADAARLAVKGGEKPGDLHCTLHFLGDDETQWSDADRQEIIGCLMMMFAEFPPVTAKIFGASHWNGDGDKPSWVWSVGDQMPPDGAPLDVYHAVACDAVWMCAPVGVMIPAQHTPWVAHICAEYSDDLTLVKELEKRNGPVTFDRVRISFGHDDTDIPLTGSMTAAGGLSLASAVRSMFEKGDRVKVKGTPHMKGQGAGTIDLVNQGPAYGIIFDGMEDMGVHKWYVGEELKSETGSMTAAGVPRRKLNDFEIASRVDFAMIDKQWHDAVAGMMTDYVRVLADQRAELKDQITALVDSGDLSALDSLHVDTEQCARLLRDHMLRYAQRAGTEMQREAEHQGVQVPPWDLDSTILAASAVDVITATARATARNLGFGVVQSAARRVMSMVGIKRSGREVANAVDESIKTLSTAGPKEQIGAAMSAAQNAGRVAVLSVAPAGLYVATEALDQNTCKACRSIDGTEFESLAAAREAYPSGGYVNCQGGGRCRGTMIAVWGKGETASAAVERTDTVGTATETLGGKPSEGTTKDKRLKENQKAADDTEALGGKPNPGTKPDKRIKENKYDADGNLIIEFDTENCDGEDCGEGTTDMPTSQMSAAHEHFAAQTLADVQAAWDGSSSRFDDAQWKKATAACDTGDGTVKERCFLPHHDPGGALNLDGLAAAAGRANQAGSHSPAAVARAKAHLRSHYNKAGKPVPDNLKATAEERATFGVELDYDLNVWGPPVEFAQSDNACPPNMEMDPATGECKPMGGNESAAKTAAWEGVLVVEGETTGDGREFAADSLTWPDPIQPGEVLLRWNKVDSHGGTPRTEAVAVGRIDKIWKDGNKIMGAGVFDLANPDGAEAYRRVKDKFLRGVSIDADDVKNADVELVWPEPTGDEEADIMSVLFGQPDKMIYHGGRIRAATLCDIPAFIEAWVALTDDEGAVVAGGAPDLKQAVENQNNIVAKRIAFKKSNRALVAHGGPDWRPPAEWFENPSFTVPTTIHVSDEGRVYGHAAQWEACHIGFMDVCTKPPREDDFPYFLTGELTTAEGTTVPVGQITVSANHADLYTTAGAAKEHYENTGNAVADVRVGADRIGIWVAGAIRANADPHLIHELRASGNVSGDWRKIGGQYRLVGLLGVNVGGFVVPGTKARVAGGQVQALVAAGRLNVARPMARSAQMEREQAYKIVMDDLYAQMFGPDSGEE